MESEIKAIIATAIENMKVGDFIQDAVLSALDAAGYQIVPKDKP